MIKFKRILLSLFSAVLVIGALLFAGVFSDNGSLCSEASAAADQSLPDDGIVITEEDVYCSCCHRHEHPDNLFGKYACFVCRIGQFLKNIYGIAQEDAPHKYLLVSSSAPTCFVQGERLYQCGVCEKTQHFTDRRLIHKPKITKGTPATCMEDGLSDSSVCELCDTVLSVQTVIPQLGHLPRALPYVLPTCTQEGLTAGSYCGRCDEIIVPQTAVPATGHDFIDGAKAENLKIYPTGTNKTTADIICYSCNKKITAHPVNAAATVGGYERIYHTLEAAVKAAVNTNVYLISDYTLESDLTIPAGVTVVIPASASDNGYFKRDDDGFFSYYCPDNYTQDINIHSFRRLTVPEGRTIDVQNGGILYISAVTGLFGGGNPASYGISDGYGEILLGGTVNVQNGGIFDCSGYVRDGGGEVNLLSGAKMFETYGILYWRGGSYGAAASTEKIFPIDGYEMNYMRAKLNIASGAVLLGSCKMCAGAFPNINESKYYYCHFKLLGAGDGYVYQLLSGARAQRTVDEGGRVTIKFFGNVNFGSSSISVGITSFKTSNFQAYKIDGNYTYEFYDGTVTCQQKCQFMPGAVMIVGKGATVEVSSTSFNGGALIFCTAKDYPDCRGYYYYDSQYVGALYPAGRDDARLIVKDGGRVNVSGKNATLAGLVYVDSLSSVSFIKNANKTAQLSVAVGPVNGASLAASVDTKTYTIPYMENKLS